MTKHIFVTGGVVSSLGKGLTSASIGLLLESMGMKVAMQKLDPYINVDPGTMNPHQHGEVYVTEDGLEGDLDLGHYERFTTASVNIHSNYTTGKIYSSVIARERRGEYLGQTVQVIPHITNEIKDAIRRVEGPAIDVAITEIGGTVGDIESLPFLEAIRQYQLDAGRDNVMYIHLTLIPFLHASQEIKTKPTQQSVGKLREIGIFPDLLICRTEVALGDDVRAKISLFCNVPKDAVIEEKDVDFSIYQIPQMLAEQKVDEQIIRRLGLSGRRPELARWNEMVETLRNPDSEVTIGIVGKYMDMHDAYKSIYESLTHAGIANRCKVKIKKIPAEDVERQGMAKFMDGVSGILVPGGFGHRGIEGKIKAAQHARECNIPYYGLCLGMQIASIEFARNVVGLPGANSTEFDPKTPHPVIHMMERQRTITEKGGTMRLGSYPCRIEPDSRAWECYQRENVSERHRHRFEFNNQYRDAFRARGMKFSGIWPEGNLVEIVELENHPWYVGVQFHPEFESKPVSPHPLFRGFIKAALTYSRPKAPVEKLTRMSDKRVDEDWKKRAQAEKQTDAAKFTPPPAAPEAPGIPGAAPAKPDLKPNPLFGGLVESLASQALMYMGAMRDPMTGQAHQDLQQSQTMIEMLAMLEEKTKGNLAKEEADMIKQVLDEVRMHFVRITTPPPPNPKKQ